MPTHVRISCRYVQMDTAICLTVPMSLYTMRIVVLIFYNLYLDSQLENRNEEKFCTNGGILKQYVS
jgi:hypothetical protein